MSNQALLMNKHRLLVSMADPAQLSGSSFIKCACVLHLVLALYLGRDELQYQMHTELVP